MTPTVFLFRVSIASVILLLIDLYAFHGLKTLTVNLSSAGLRNFIHITFWIITGAYFSIVIYGVVTYNPYQGPRGFLFKWFSIGLILLWLPKIVYCLFLFCEDVYRLFHIVFVSIFGKRGREAKLEETPFIPERRVLISQIGVITAALPFASVLFGVTKGKYNFKVHSHEIFFKDLPKSFDGFTITQISDIHSGSLDDVRAVKNGIALINEQKSDIVVFTGDLVNNTADEFLPWVEIFQNIEAPLGKYSITGNHDYGDYVPWPSEEEKLKNFEKILSYHSKIGFKILMNEHVVFSRNTEEIALVGVENWGVPPFPQKGDINKAIEGMDASVFKILLSHDPSHWDAQVLSHPNSFRLTLSGHTHGMQFGIEIPGIKWSPAKFKYPRWAGLYAEKEQYLYVNRGFGFIGFPGRVGIWPEITKITLRAANELKS